MALDSRLMRQTGTNLLRLSSEAFIITEADLEVCRLTQTVHQVSVGADRFN